MKIGGWVKRAGTKWHLIESIVSDDAITRCGRRMRPNPDNEREFSDVEPLTRMIGQPQNCKRCS